MVVVGEKGGGGGEDSEHCSSKMSDRLPMRPRSDVEASIEQLYLSLLIDSARPFLPWRRDIDE